MTRLAGEVSMSRIFGTLSKRFGKEPTATVLKHKLMHLMYLFIPPSLTNYSSYHNVGETYREHVFCLALLKMATCLSSHP